MRYTARQVFVRDGDSFDIEDGGMIITSIQHRDGTKVIIAEPDYICGEPKSNDEPCERSVDSPSETCWQHGDE